MRYRTCILALLALSLCVSAGLAQERTTRFGVKATVLLPGDLYVAEPNRYFDFSTSFGAGAFVDTHLADKLLGGLYLDMLEANAFDDTGLMLDLGVTLKAALRARHSGITWRPGIGVGFADLASVGGLGSTRYLTLRGGLEVVLPGGWLVEGSVYGAPTGGNSDFTVSYGPMMMIRVGRLF